jgi:hypothetical protein
LAFVCKKLGFLEFAMAARGSDGKQFLPNLEKKSERSLTQLSVAKVSDISLGK